MSRKLPYLLVAHDDFNVFKSNPFSDEKSMLDSQSDFSLDKHLIWSAEGIICFNHGAKGAVFLWYNSDINAGQNGVEDI